jgi:hypothetical protein
MVDSKEQPQKKPTNININLKHHVASCMPQV